MTYRGEWVGAEEVCALLGCTLAEYYRLRRRPDFPPRDARGRYLDIDVLAWAARRIYN